MGRGRGTRAGMPVTRGGWEQSGGWRAEHGQDTKDSASAPWRIAELGLSRDSGGPGPSLEDCLCHKGHPIMP